MNSDLILIENFISSEQEKQLIDFIDSKDNTWNNLLKRRTMHFGYEYNYHQSGTLRETKPIPKEFNEIIDLVGKQLNKYVENQPINQVIINEYLPGQGISPHIDANSFGDVIVSLSLGSDAVMEFTNITMTSTKKVNILLKRCSVIFLTKDTRYKWRHSIPARKTDKLDDGTKIERGRRISMTFRHVLGKMIN